VNLGARNARLSGFDDRYFSFLALLWCAPEIIQENNVIGTQKGDIYSFAIIASEIVTRRTAWNISERSESEEGMKGQFSENNHFLRNYLPSEKGKQQFDSP
jgi:hypothetical protein